MTTGNADITVMVEAICWDTFENGESGSDADRGLFMADVTVMPATGAVRQAVTNGNGLAGLVEIGVGRATVRVTKADYETVEGAVEITAGGTATLTLTTRNTKRECDRKHKPKPPELPFDNWLFPIFWADQPWILILRDLVWLLCGLAAVVLIIVGFAYPPASGCVAGGVLCFAVFALANHIIFGLIPGVIGLVAGFLMFIAVAVLTVLALLTTPPVPLAGGTSDAFGIPPANIFMFPPLCAIWLGFGVGLGAGRQTFSNADWVIPLAAAFAGAVLACVVFIVMYAFADPFNWSHNPGYAVGGAIAQFLVGFLMALIGGLMGYVFINDGKLEVATWDFTDYELPFAGERYCVQGNRGWISHFFKVTHGTDDSGAAVTYTTDEEYSYDWSMPERHPILAAKEGHIVAFKEDRDGNTMSCVKNKIANYVYVRHRDGTEAHYLHIVKDGFTAMNPTIAHMGVAGTLEGRPCFRFTGDPTAAPVSPPPSPAPVMPVHVYAGQQLAPAGNVGYSMFSHLHFAVQKKVTSSTAGARNFHTIKFKDPDVAVHEGRCFSMRKYRSSNKDRGPVRV